MFLGVKDELTKARHSLGLLAINYEYFNEQQREVENERIFRQLYFSFNNSDANQKLVRNEINVWDFQIIVIS